MIIGQIYKFLDKIHVSYVPGRVFDYDAYDTLEWNRTSFTKPKLSTGFYYCLSSLRLPNELVGHEAFLISFLSYRHGIITILWPEHWKFTENFKKVRNYANI